ncbi:MAG: hypothetical protein GX648_11420 [Crenarchaeota archaeon]|jgi:hypothetical protein|nr:hypothetical protein [Thermoproteota archaeon]
MDDFPSVAFKIATGKIKSDRDWLKKKCAYLEAMWKRNGAKILGKIEDACGDTFTNTSKREGITVILHKRSPKDRSGALNSDNPLEINLFLAKSDTTNALKERLIRMLVHSFIHQKYEFNFRVHEQTLFEDILADEYVTSLVSFAVLGRKLGRVNCEKALDEALDETVCRLSQKPVRNSLVDILYNFSQQPASTSKGKKRKTDILEKREELIIELLNFLPKNIRNN